jgi:hypothetical protein
MLPARELVAALAPAAMPFEESTRAARLPGWTSAGVEGVPSRLNVMFAALVDGDALAADSLECELLRNHR